MVGCLAPGFPEVFASPRGGNCAVEVTSIVAAVGAGIPRARSVRGVAASDSALGAAQGLSGAWPHSRRHRVRGGLTAVAREPSSRGTLSLPALGGVGQEPWHWLLGEVRRPSCQRRAARKNNQERGLASVAFTLSPRG